MSCRRSISFIVVSILLALIATILSANTDTKPTSTKEEVILEVDHIYICVGKEAPEAIILQEAGLILDSDTSRFADQGNAAVYIFMENFYLELMWIEKYDLLEQSDKQLSQKFKDIENGGSPFGLGLRRKIPASDSLPFETKPYSEEWMKSGTSIDIAKIEHPAEPEIFVVPPYMGWDSIAAEISINQSGQSVIPAHPAGIKKLTGISIAGPGLPTKSNAISVLMDQGIVMFVEAEEHFVELIFDEGSQGKKIDARPELPLLIHY